ncbi:hypothetical protein LTR27_009099 [Elasticomyces elasticus]|nr:hypothetical protein LTR27_009099 [Elasticomyces elasticus]
MVYHTYGSDITQRRLRAICSPEYYYHLGVKTRDPSSFQKVVKPAYLHACGITYDRYDSLQRLNVQWQRFRKGLLALGNCSKVELRRFCKRRGLGTHEHAGRDSTTEALEKADENPKFERFCELPAELRELVWEWRAVW